MRRTIPHLTTTPIFCAVAALALVSGWMPDGVVAQGSGQGQPGVAAITPVFSQLVMIQLPAGFKTAFEQVNKAGDFYIREAVPSGETVERWSQMVTLTGRKGLATVPNATAQAVLGEMAKGFERACPTSYAARKVEAAKISGNDTFVAILGCGTIKDRAGDHSEIAVITVVKGKADVYTVQWAERGPASPAPPSLDDPKWAARRAALSPIKVCDRVPGEAPPFPSCINSK